MASALRLRLDPMSPRPVTAWTRRLAPAISAADPALVPGLAILNIPKYTETTSLNYTRPAFGGLDFTARLNNSLVGPMTDIEYTYAQLPSYDLVGVRLGLVNERLSVYVFGDNVTDKRAQLGINTTAFAWTIPSVERVVTNQPRTIGEAVVLMPS